MSHIFRGSQIRVAIISLALAGMTTFGVAQQAPAKAPPTLVFMTDFGVVDDSVAICKGVMYSIAPALRIERKAIVVLTKRGQLFVLPDNGLITLVADRDGIESVREITNRAWMIGGRLSSTFHGRDVFSPVGAHLARGDDWRQVGPEMAVVDLVRLDWQEAVVDEHGLRGQVIATDGPFGNLVTNVSAEEFFRLGYRRGRNVPVVLGEQEMVLSFVRTFSDVPLNKPLLYIDSRGRLSFAINQGNFAAVYEIKPPMKFAIPKAKD